MQFEADAALNENAEFFPIIFEPLDPDTLMAGTDAPTKRPTSSPSVRPTMEPSRNLTPIPTIRPTMKPSNSPTADLLPCGIPTAVRSQQITEILDVDSPDQYSPQYLALDWITNKDSIYICPDDEKALIQRYVAVVFYYSTGGGAWNQCNAPNNLSDDAAVERANEECKVRAATFPDFTSGSKAWLTASNECEWGGLACNFDGSIGEISFGESNTLCVASAPVIALKCLTYINVPTQKIMVLSVLFLLS